MLLPKRDSNVYKPAPPNPFRYGFNSIPIRDGTSLEELKVIKQQLLASIANNPHASNPVFSIRSFHASLEMRYQYPSPTYEKELAEYQKKVKAYRKFLREELGSLPSEVSDD